MHALELGSAIKKGGGEPRDDLGSVESSGCKGSSKVQI